MSVGSHVEVGAAESERMESSRGRAALCGPPWTRLIWGLCLASALWAASFPGLCLAQAATETPAAPAKPETTETDTPSAGTETDAAEPTDYELMKVFVDSFSQIDSNYVKEVDRRKLVEAAIRGMLTELDPYSNYISPDVLPTFDQAISQQFGGVGMRVDFDPEDHSIEVVSPLPGTPAYEAGVKSGDRIIEIRGEKVADFGAGMEVQRAIELLQGPAGEEVSFSVRRAGEQEPITFTMKRAIIKVETVLGDRYRPDGTVDFMIDPEQKIGYIRLTHFSERTPAEMLNAMRQLTKQEVKGLVLDLRFNPGGLLTAAIEISDMFVSSGKIVSVEGRNTNPKQWTAKARNTYGEMPIAVIVNRYSASASEIVSACLQDHQRAIVVGERTWGKGSVQNVIELENGKSALKLTTAAYFRPSGRNIHRFPGAKTEDEWGVMPDTGYLVEFSGEQMSKYLEYRKQRDKLAAEPQAGDFEDLQLNKALEYVREKLKSGTNGKAAAENPADVPNPAPAAQKPSALLPVPLPSIGPWYG